MCIKCCSTLTCFISSVEMLFSCLSLLSKAQDFLQRPWFIIHPWLHTSHIVCLRSALINVSAAFLLSARLCSFCECPCFVLYILYYIFSIFAFNFWFNFSCDMFSGFSQLHTVLSRPDFPLDSAFSSSTQNSVARTMYSSAIYLVRMDSFSSFLWTNSPRTSSIRSFTSNSASCANGSSVRSSSWIISWERPYFFETYSFNIS